MRGSVRNIVGRARLPMLALFVVLGLVGSGTVQALNFAVYPFEELAEEADEIVIGTIVRKQGKETSENLRYEIRVREVIKGETAAGETIKVEVLNWADDGIMHKGKTYLLLLNQLGAEGYGVSGVHQGFIQLKDGGGIESRFYDEQTITDYLQSHGITEQQWATEEVAESQGASYWLVTAGIAGVVLLAAVAILFAAKRRR